MLRCIQTCTGCAESLNFGFLAEDFRISGRKFVAVTSLASGALAWFFLLSVYLPRMLTTMIPDPILAVTGQVVFFVTGIVSAVIGSIVSQKVNIRKFLISWIMLGVISTAALSLSLGTILSIFMTFALGVSLGLGLPSSLAFLADSTIVEERGRIAGITILISFLLAFLAIAISGVFGGELIVIILSGIAIKLTSFLALILDKCERPIIGIRTQVVKPNYRELSFYLLPWIMFAMASVIASNVVPKSEDFQSAVLTGTILRYALIALFGLIWGVLADRVGRKMPIIFGLIALGLSFSMLTYSMTPSTVLVYLAISGVAWGAFFTIYLVIPGDLSNPGRREKFYTLGSISPLTAMISIMLILTALETQFALSSFSNVLSVMLFLSIIPVLRAKETLQESKVQERRLKEHVEKVGKIIKESEGQ